MKQAVNFRLNTQTMLVLVELQKACDESKTAIVENAILYYAKKQLPKQNPLLQYAGCLGRQDAEGLLKKIKRNRHNKNLDALTAIGFPARHKSSERRSLLGRK